MKISQSQPAPLEPVVQRGSPRGFHIPVAHRPAKPPAAELEHPIDVAVHALARSQPDDLDGGDLELPF